MVTAVGCCLRCVCQNGLTALSIAQRLGYISVVEILRHVTDVTVTPAAAEDKYKVIAPETMQEAPMSDSEEEGGKLAGHTFYVSPPSPPLSEKSGPFSFFPGEVFHAVSSR